MNFEVNTAISFIDVFIVIVLIWAIYKGYKRGPLVHAVSLLVIVLGLAIFGSISRTIADTINERLTNSVETLHYYIFIILFSITIWISILIADKTEGSMGAKPKGILNIVLGILASSLKYLYLLSVFLLFFSQFDNEYEIISSKEKKHSQLYETVKNIAPSTIKTVSFLQE